MDDKAYLSLVGHMMKRTIRRELETNIRKAIVPWEQQPSLRIALRQPVAKGATACRYCGVTSTPVQGKCEHCGGAMQSATRVRSSRSTVRVRPAPPPAPEPLWIR